MVIFCVADGVVGLQIGVFYDLWACDGRAASLAGVTATVAGLVEVVGEPRRISGDSRRSVEMATGVVYQASA